MFERARSQAPSVEKTIETRKEYGLLKLRETWVVKEATAKSMRGNRGQDTKPERTLRQALWQAGLRGYRKNRKGLPGRPDVAFGKAKLAVFVHGCYWHQCPHCSRNRTPKTNSAYWRAKFEGNVARDARNQTALEGAGWRVLIAWECEIKRDVQAVVEKVRAAMG